MLTSVMGYLWFNGEDTWWLTMGKLVAMFAIVIVLGVKSLDHVKQTEMALKLRWGRTCHHWRDKPARRRGEPVMFGHGEFRWPLGWRGHVLSYRKDRLGHFRGDVVKIGPGLFIGIPIMHSLLKTENQVRLLRLSPQARPRPDGLIYLEEPALNWRVVDMVRALIEQHDVTGQVLKVADAAYRQMVEAGKRIEDIERDLVLDPDVLVKVAKLGVKIDDLQVTTNNPAPNLIMGMSSAVPLAQRSMRMNAAALSNGHVNGNGAPGHTYVGGDF